LMQIAPGGPFTSEEDVPEEVEKQLNESYGLSDPWYEQYTNYMVSIAKWDLGSSIKSSRSINDIINESFPISLFLGFEAILIALALGVLFGVISALRQNEIQDYAVMVIAIFGISVPNFILAAGLQYILAIKLHILPVAKFDSFF